MSLKSAKSEKSKVAYVEDEDDDGNLNNKAFATSTAGSPQIGTAKMNISKKKSSLREREREREYHEPAPLNSVDSDSTAHPSRRDSKSGRSSRRREPSVPPQQSRRGAPRPDPPKHSNTAPAMEPHSERRRPSRDQSHYYEPEIRSQSRPRSKTAAPRPSSFYGAPPPPQQPMHPPVANNRYHMMHQGGMAPPPPSASAIPRGGFAPPPQFAPLMPGPPMHQQHWQPPPPPLGPPHGVPHHGPSHSFSGYGMMPTPTMRPPGPPSSHHDPFQVQGLPMPPPSKPFDIVGGGRMMPPLDPFPMGSHTPRSEPFGMAGYVQPPPARDLHQRFARPQTSIGHRPQLPVDYDDRDHERDLDYDRGRDRYEEPLSNSMRRLSMGYKSKYEEPNRAMSARPQASPFIPPALPPPRERSTHRGVDRGLERLMDRPHREHRQYDDLYEDPEDSFYDNSSPYDEPPMRTPRHRRESIEPSQYSYESRPYATEIARTTGNRRGSYYGDSNSSSAFEDKMRLASSYQEDKGGGMRLTADLLHGSEHDRHGPRSRSTRSSGSRDESDWRQSATTRTTRTTHTSNNGEDDLCIRVRNGKVLEMQYADGTGITINHPQNRHYSIGEQSMYGDDDRQSRFDRPALRSRAASRAASRAGSIYAPPENAIEYSYGGGDYSDDSPFAPREVNRYIRDH